MKKINSTVIGIIIISVLLVGGAIIAFVTTKSTSISQYSADDINRPQFIIGQTNFDFGKMAIKDTKTQEIPIKNNGKDTLVLSDFITSCDCTFAQVIINGQESPKFSMHRNPNWRGEILSGGAALIKITYEPKIMPVKGLVKREIIFKTNDPNQPLVHLSFIANVE